jgi:protein-tyrosine phosphatase
MRPTKSGLVDWITDNIAIGNYLDALDRDLIRRQRIVSALSLDGTLRAKTAHESGLSRVEVVLLDDGPGNDPRLFQLAVAHLVDLVNDAPPVLVQCHAGRSRSAIVVAGYFVKTLGLEPTDALKLVGDKREIAVTAGLESLLETL